MTLSKIQNFTMKLIEHFTINIPHSNQTGENKPNKQTNKNQTFLTKTAIYDLTYYQDKHNPIFGGTDIFNFQKIGKYKF